MNVAIPGEKPSPFGNRERGKAANTICIAAMEPFYDYKLFHFVKLSCAFYSLSLAIRHDLYFAISKGPYFKLKYRMKRSFNFNLSFPWNAIWHNMRNAFAIYIFFSSRMCGVKLLTMQSRERLGPCCQKAIARKRFNHLECTIEQCKTIPWIHITSRYDLPTWYQPRLNRQIYAQLT